MGEKMQASGGGKAKRDDGVGGPEAGGSTGAGQSGGGAYPNPHANEDSPNDGFLGHGGQSDIAYHGPGQLGDEKVGDGDNNSATRDD